MDIDYTCGCKFRSYKGTKAPLDCPSCGKGSLVGVQDQFYMSDGLRKRLQEALFRVKIPDDVKPLTGISEKQYQMRVECPDHGLTIGQTFCSGCRERYRLIEQAQDLINERDPESTEDVLNLLYDAGMLRKAGDQ